MAGLTDKLSRLADRPVVDKTNLTGSYDSSSIGSQTRDSRSTQQSRNNWG